MVNLKNKSKIVFILNKSIILQLCHLSDNTLVNSNYTDDFFDFAHLRYIRAKIILLIIFQKVAPS